MVPTLTGDRRRGTAVIIADVTHEKERDDGRAFLSQAPAALADQESADGIFQKTAEELFSFIPGCRLVWASSIDPASGLLIVTGIQGGEGVTERLTDVFGMNPAGFTIPGKNVLSSPVASLHFHQGILVEGPPVCTMFFGFYPEETCRKIAHILGPGKSFFIGICHGGELFGASGSPWRRTLLWRTRTGPISAKHKSDANG